jgi:hypothetical protein
VREHSTGMLTYALDGRALGVELPARGHDGGCGESEVCGGELEFVSESKNRP